MQTKMKKNANKNWGGSPWQGGMGGVMQGMLGYHIPPVNRMTNRCKNITLPQTSFAGGNYENVVNLSDAKHVRVSRYTELGQDCS